MAVLVFRPVVRSLAVAGHGYIAGEAPDGIVTLDNVPGRAEVDLLRRSDHVWLQRQISRDDGTYRFEGLPLGVEFDVIGRDMTNTWGDVIVSRVLPYAPPQITTASLSFQSGIPAAVQMEAQYGGEPFTWSVDVPPPGLSLSASGEWTGSATTPGSYPVVVSVLDTFGEGTSRSYTITVT